MDQMADAAHRPLSRKEHLTPEESLRVFSTLGKEKERQDRSFWQLNQQLVSHFLLKEEVSRSSG